MAAAEPEVVLSWATDVIETCFQRLNLRFRGRLAQVSRRRRHATLTDARYPRCRPQTGCSIISRYSSDENVIPTVKPMFMR